MCQTHTICMYFLCLFTVFCCGENNEMGKVIGFCFSKTKSVEVREYFHGLIHLGLRVPGLTWLPPLATRRMQAVERRTTSCTQRVPRTWRPTSALCWCPSKLSTYCGSPAPSPPDRSACECNTDETKI